MDLLEQEEKKRVSRGMSLAQATPPGPHLGRVQPVLEVLSTADMWQHQLEKAMFTCQGEQGSAHSNTQQQEEAREMTNPHLEGLRSGDSSPSLVCLTAGVNRQTGSADRKCLPR